MHQAIRITPLGASPEQLLYFTSTSLLADDCCLVFLGEQDGHPNLFWRDPRAGTQRQLTFNTEGSLKSYVYFDGRPYRGLGKASVSLDPQRGIAYYIQGRQICSVDVAGRIRILAEYPAGQMTAFTHVSADGTRLCVPTTDERALDGDAILSGQPAYNIDARVQAENLCSYLRIYDTRTGQELMAEPVPRAWITHVQFSPLERDLILYNHEWPAADCGIRRMWLWDGRCHRRLRTEGDGRSRRDWTCHEMWERDGSAIIYHGSYAGGRGYLGRVLPDGTDQVEIPFPDGFRRYGHFTVGRPGMLVSDGYYQEEDTGEKGAGSWISLQRVNWAARDIQWIPLLQHGSSWTSQDSHPHPIFDHAAHKVYFTSDRGGSRAIYHLDATAALTGPSSVEQGR